LAFLNVEMNIKSPCIPYVDSEKDKTIAFVCIYSI